MPDVKLSQETSPDIMLWFHAHLPFCMSLVSAWARTAQGKKEANNAYCGQIVIFVFYQMVKN